MRAAFVIPGDPVSQGSLTFYGPGKVAHPPKLIAWRKVAEVAIYRPRWRPIAAPCDVRIVALFKRPPSHYGKGKNAGVLRDAAPVIPKLDADKTARACLDILTIAGFWNDDWLAWRVSVAKFYTDRAAETHIEVTWLTKPTSPRPTTAAPMGAGI